MLQFNPIKQLFYKQKNSTFEQFTTIIQQVTLKKNVHAFLKKLNIHSHPHQFLILFVITGYKQHILEPTKTSNDLFTISNRVLLQLQEIVNSNDLKETQQKQFQKLFTQYLKIFQNWKKQDLISQIQIYCDSYWELQTIRDNNPQTVYQTEIEKIQFRLQNQIKKLDKNGLQLLQDYQQIYNQKQKQIKKVLKHKITKTMKKAYWKHVPLLLQEDPPNLKWIPNMLKDINHSFKKLVSNNEKWKKHIDEYLDYEFIGNQILNNCFEFSNCFKLADFMLSTLKELGIPEKDKEITELQSWVSKSKTNPDFKLHEFLPKLFKEIMEHIEEIQFIINLIKKNKTQ